VVRTAEYYRDVLGFEIVGYWATPPAFAIVRRNRVEMFFNRADGSPPRTGRAGDAYDAYLHASGVEALAGELRQRGAEIIEGPVCRRYRQIELVVRDCSGLVIAFGEEMSEPAST
jgi:catechol 2,3-dioxygenase-like lactoylglutathione lyase family enzyme